MTRERAELPWSLAHFSRAVFSSDARDSVVQVDEFPLAALLYLQRCCQGHGAAIFASGWDQRFTALSVERHGEV